MNPIISFLFQRLTFPKFALLIVTIVAVFSTPTFATTKGLSQIVTPDLQDEGDLSLSLQIQDSRIANPYELQAEMGVTKWAEFAVFRGLQPDDWIFGTEFGLIQKEPYLLSAGFVNWSPQNARRSAALPRSRLLHRAPQVHARRDARRFRNEVILGYAYDFNQQWRAQVDFQSGSGNSSTIGFTWNITPDFQMNPALYVANDKPHDLMGYVVFTYTFHLWSKAVEKAKNQVKAK